MKFKCSECYKNDPCILEFKKIGEFLPEYCPFGRINNKLSEWKEIKEKKND